MLKRFVPILLSLGLFPGVLAAQEVVHYYHLDAIGNVRALTNQSGNVVERHDYLPFGEECTTGPCATNPAAGAGQPKKFTGKERDVETGLDYFGARYYGSKIARFTTVDPVYTWRENLVDPQRWNRYAYGRNNPFRYVDPDGKEVVPVEVIMTGGDWRLTYIDTRLVARLHQFVQDASDAKVSFTFNNVFRTEDEQEGLTTNNTKNKSGTSPHLAGVAFDINVASSLNGTDLKGLTNIAKQSQFEPLKNQKADPPHFQANDLITRGSDGKVDANFRLLIQENQRQVDMYERLRNLGLFDAVVGGVERVGVH